jgi:membrane protease YdiL (CAAX protease family)
MMQTQRVTTNGDDCPNAPPSRRVLNLFPALGLVLMIVATEYLTRHFVIFWIPVLGSLRVNDMLMSGAGYLVLVWLTVPPERRTFAALRRTVGEIWSFIHNREVQIAAALALGMGCLSLMDQFLWGHIQIPFLTNPWKSDVKLFEPVGLLLTAVSLLLVNGVVVPFAEEWLWRGLIQPRMIGSLGFLPGLLITSVLFSLKHAIIDASLGRLLAIIGFGIVMGVVASRHGWRASALAHALANTIATIVGLVVTAGRL